MRREDGVIGMCVLAAVVAVGSAARAAAVEPPAAAPSSGAQTFSSICSDAENGDFRGLRIIVEGDAGSMTVTMEEPGGAVLASSKTKDVTYTRATGRLRFHIQEDTESATFEGTMSPTMLDGTLVREDGTKETVHLPQDKGGDSDVACRVAPDTAKP